MKTSIIFPSSEELAAIEHEQRLVHIVAFNGQEVEFRLPYKDLTRLVQALHWIEGIVFVKTPEDAGPTEVVLSPLELRYSSVLAVGPIEETEDGALYKARYNIYLEGLEHPIIRNVTSDRTQMRVFQRAIELDHIKTLERFRESVAKERHNV